MKRYFKIGEISRLFGIGADTVRYYEELGVIRPARGDNGYRLYSIQDIWRINVIRDLRALGFSVERIGRYLNNRNIASTLSLLTEQQAAIEREIRRLSRQRENISRRMAVMCRAETVEEGVIRLEHFAPRRCHEICEGYGSDEEMDVLVQRLLSVDPQRLYIIGSSYIGSRLCREALLEGRYNRYSSVFIIDEHGGNELPEGEYFCVNYRGESKKTGLFAPMLLRHAEERGYRPAGDMLELLLTDIHESSDTREHTTELQLRVLPV